MHLVLVFAYRTQMLDMLLISRPLLIQSTDILVCLQAPPSYRLDHTPNDCASYPAYRLPAAHTLQGSKDQKSTLSRSDNALVNLFTSARAGFKTIFLIIFLPYYCPNVCIALVFKIHLMK